MKPLQVVVVVVGIKTTDARFTVHQRATGRGHQPPWPGPEIWTKKKLNPDFIGIVLLLNYCYSSVSLATWKLAFFVFPIFFAAAAAAFNIFGKSFLITARNCAATCATVISLSLEGRPWFVMSGYEGSQGGQAFVFEGREREWAPYNKDHVR